MLVAPHPHSPCLTQLHSYTLVIAGACAPSLHIDTTTPRQQQALANGQAARWCCHVTHSAPCANTKIQAKTHAGRARPVGGLHGPKNKCSNMSKQSQYNSGKNTHSCCGCRHRPHPDPNNTHPYPKRRNTHAYCAACCHNSHALRLPAVHPGLTPPGLPLPLLLPPPLLLPWPSPRRVPSSQHAHTRRCSCPATAGQGGSQE